MPRSLHKGGVVRTGTRGGAIATWRRRLLHLMLLAFIGIGTVLMVANQANGQGTEPPAESQATQAQDDLLLPEGPYVTQLGDTCISIAESIAGRSGDETIREFRAVNYDTVSRDAKARGVPFTDCPITAFETYSIPANWVPERFHIRTVEVLVDDDWPHWKSFSTWGVGIALVVGLIAGAIVATTIGRILKGHERPELGHS